MKTLWKIIDGNKTIICFGIPVLLQNAIEFHLIPETQFILFVIKTFTVLGGGALVHHAKKGYFKKDKGN